MTPVSPIIFLHIPKTAGTTVHHILHNKYHSSSLFTGDYPHNVQKFCAFSEAQRKKIKVLKGHFAYGIHQYYPGPISYFTFLRDPLKRTISGYNYVFQNKKHAFHEEMIREKYSLKDFLKQGKLKIFDNCQVRYLAGAVDLEFGAVNEETYQAALKNLETGIRVFGICERFDESLLLIAKELKWSAPFYLSENISERSTNHKPLDEETMQLINMYNKYDLMLYKYAAEKFDLIVEKAGLEFQKEVADFKRRNKFQAPLRRIIRNIWKSVQRISGS